MVYTVFPLLIATRSEEVHHLLLFHKPTSLPRYFSLEHHSNWIISGEHLLELASSVCRTSPANRCAEKDQTLTITVSSAAGMTELLTHVCTMRPYLLSTFHYLFTVNKLMPKSVRVCACMCVFVCVCMRVVFVCARAWCVCDE